MGAPSPGSAVAYWSDDEIAFGVVVGEEKQRLVVVNVHAREDRITPTRVVAALGGGAAPARTPAGLKDAAGRATAVEAAVRKMSDEVDVPTLRELLGERDDVISEETLADLALGRKDEASRLATVLALMRDGVRFTRKGTGWRPREAEAIAEILDGREKARLRASEKTRTIEAFARAWTAGEWKPTGSETERKLLAALEALAVHDLDAPEKDRQAAVETLQSAGVTYDRPAEGAFLLLRRTGEFASDDENLTIARYGLRTEFPPEVESAARAAAEAGFDRAGRRDLTDRVVVTIDDPSTREIDDALSLAVEGDTVELGVHIADPCAFVEEGSALDLEARGRGTTYYFPDRKLLMLPSAISERAASLIAGEDRPALSFLIILDASGKIARCEIVRSVIHVAARLDYAAVDRTLEEGAGPHAELLARLDAIAETRERLRRASGALTLRAPEAEIRVGEGGELTLARRDPSTPAQRIVAEGMILAGEAAAGWLDARRLASIYRRQAPPDGALPEADRSLPEAVHVRAVRRMLKRAEASLHPSPHHGLGLNAYVQVTSPLRRYQDLAVHRQVVAALRGAAPPYDAAAMQEVLAGTERAEMEARRAERASARYWLLKWLDRAHGGTVTGVVVETMPRPIVVLDDTLLEEPVPSLSGSSIGDRVRLRVVRVNARADLATLRPA